MKGRCERCSATRGVVVTDWGELLCVMCVAEAKRLDATEWTVEEFLRDRSLHAAA